MANLMRKWQTSRENGESRKKMVRSCGKNGESHCWRLMAAQSINLEPVLARLKLKLENFKT